MFRVSSGRTDKLSLGGLSSTVAGVALLSRKFSSNDTRLEFESMRLRGQISSAFQISRAKTSGLLEVMFFFLKLYSPN